MNYLAHAYLSFNNSEILVGNMISDFVKGKRKFDFSPAIQQGIALHRAIDHFTDNHQASKEAKSFFKTHYGLYGAAFIDIVYDHFLSIDANEFSDLSLFSFSQQVYSKMDEYISFFPEKFLVLYPYMKTYNWLYNYQHRWAIKRSFDGLVHRAVYLTESDHAFRIFQEQYAKLRQCYDDFFPSVKQFAYKMFQAIP